MSRNLSSNETVESQRVCEHEDTIDVPFAFRLRDLHATLVARIHDDASEADEAGLFAMLVKSNVV